MAFVKARMGADFTDSRRIRPPKELRPLVSIAFSATRVELP